MTAHRYYRIESAATGQLYFREVPFPGIARYITGDLPRLLCTANVGLLCCTCDRKGYGE